MRVKLLVLLCPHAAFTALHFGHLCNYSCYIIRAFGPLVLVQCVLADTCNICIFTDTKSTAHVKPSHTVLQEICSAITNTEPGPINDGCNLHNCGKHSQTHDLPEIQTQSFMGKNIPDLPESEPGCRESVGAKRFIVSGGCASTWEFANYRQSKISSCCSKCFQEKEGELSVVRYCCL